MNGKHALLSVQQKNKEFVDSLWIICNGLNIIVNPVKKLIRLDKRSYKTTIAYGFQTFTPGAASRPWPTGLGPSPAPGLPYFTNLYKQWYQRIGKTIVKVIPIDKTLTPLAIAYWVAGDGTFDKSRSKVILCTDNFTKEEYELL